MKSDPLKKYPEKVDAIIHSPGRFLILNMLKQLEYADFKFLLNETGMSKGNLSVHTSKLENAGYIVMTKTIENKTTLTTYKITELGIIALDRYKKQIRALVS